MPEKSPMESRSPGARRILAFGPGSWPAGWVYGSPRYHLHGLAGAGYSVVYVEPPQGRLRNRAVLRGDRAYRPGGFDVWADRALRVYHPATLLFFHPRLPLPACGLRLWNRLALGRLAGEVSSSLRKQNMQEHARPDLLWLGAFHHGPLLDRVPHRRSVAFIYDDLPASPAWGERGARAVARLEAELLERVDLAVFTSKTLLDSRAARCRRAMLLENAVSEEFFDDSLPPRPRRGEGSGVLERIEALPRPRIGYVGAVNLRLDFELCGALAAAARARAWQVVFAGGVDHLYRGRVDELAKLPNVHVPGHVPPTEVPHLLRLFDVLILPHVVTPFTRAMFPEKLPEYLATGRPIVSTRLPEVERVVREASGATHREGRDEEGRERHEVAREETDGKANRRARIETAEEKLDSTREEHPPGAAGSDKVFFADRPEAFVAACAESLETAGDAADASARIALARRHTRDIRLRTLLRALDDLFQE